jgi:hypothetical protein
MSNTTPRTLTRNQIASIVGNDPRAIKAFELLLKQSGIDTPFDVQELQQYVSDVYLEAAGASSKSDQALSLLSSIANSLEVLSMAPPVQPSQSVDDVSPPVNVAPQQDQIDGTGIDVHSGLTEAHGATGAVVGTTNAQTLSNKTLAAPTVTGLTDLQGGQIKFPATQSPSADPNTLDDYEEGTFTPAVVGFSTAGVGTYTQQVGSYVKIGSIVHFTINITITAHTGTGVMIVTGLPFNANAGKNFAVQGRTNNLAYNAGYTLQFAVSAGSTNVDLEQVPSGGGAAANIPMDTAFSIYLTGTYSV